MNNPNPKPPVFVVWWVVWASILMGLPMMYLFLKPPQPEIVSPALRYLPFALFAGSVALRWALLPQIRVGSKALPVFVIGLVLAEMCTMTGIFLAPDWRNIYLALGIVAIVQFAPIFASEYY